MIETETRAEALTSACEAHMDRPGDDRRHVLEPEETLIPGAAEIPASVDAVVDEEIAWEPTHFIGPYTVHQRTFVSGLQYWVEENGKRRRPTKDNPLRRFAPRPDPAKQMWLDKAAFSLLMAAYFQEEIDRAEDQVGNVAQRVDADHVLLSLVDKAARTHTRYLVQIPEEFEVIGSRMP